MFIYIDESTFTKNNEEYHGVGLFATNEEVKKDIIDKALINLENDPDIYDKSTNSMDMGTLNRGYFHATDDSKNGHSHLCSSISNSINGVFKYAYTKPSSNSDLRSIEDIYRLNTQLVSLLITEYRNPIYIYIEQRTKLTQIIATRIIKDLYNMIDMSTYSAPYLSSFYPKIMVNVVNKDNPGIQVTDFILWAVNNKYSNNKKSNWIEYLGMRFSDSYDQPEGDMAGGAYKLKLGIQENYTKTNAYPNDIFPLQDNYYNQVSLENIYLLAEQFIHFISINGLPPHAMHFEEELIKITKILKSNSVSNEDIQVVAKLFIRLFDTIPFYSNLNRDNDLKQFELLLHVRRCMGLILNGKISNRNAVDVFRETRDKIVENNKEALTEEPALDKWL